MGAQSGLGIRAGKGGSKENLVAGMGSPDTFDSLMEQSLGEGSKLKVDELEGQGGITVGRSQFEAIPRLWRAAIVLGGLFSLVLAFLLFEWPSGLFRLGGEGNQSGITVLMQLIEQEIPPSPTTPPLRPPLPPPRPRTCPHWFRHIESDLAHWRRIGIDCRKFEVTEKYLEKLAVETEGLAIRVQIIGGQLYATPTGTDWDFILKPRAMFTLWGLLLLLRRYPVELPDVDILIFVSDICHQQAPEGSMWRWHRRWRPLLACSCHQNEGEHAGIVWPDWSFWGWPELHIDSWSKTCRSMATAGGEWRNRTALAFWRGNPETSQLRKDLMECDPPNANPPHPYLAELHDVKWLDVRDFRNVALENECKYRYVIYAEGNTWSVSYKYALCCGSVVVAPTPKFHDFFSRALAEQQDVVFVPRGPRMCESIREVVERGNSGALDGELLGRAAQNFGLQDLSMDNVYDYMYHTLHSYSHFLAFAPQPSPNATLVNEDWFRETFRGTPYENAFELEEATTRVPCVL